MDVPITRTCVENLLESVSVTLPILLFLGDVFDPEADDRTVLQEPHFGDHRVAEKAEHREWGNKLVGQKERANVRVVRAARIPILRGSDLNSERTFDDRFPSCGHVAKDAVHV